MGLAKNCTSWKDDPIRKENEVEVGEREREMIFRDLRQGTGMQKPQRMKVTDHEVPEQKVTFTDQGVWLWWWGTKWHPLESVSRCP